MSWPTKTSQTQDPFGAVNNYKDFLTQNSITSDMYKGFNPAEKMGLADSYGGFQRAEGNNGLFGMSGMEQMGKGIGIAGDLFGMYNQYQAMKMAKNQMNNQARTSNYNMENNTNFKNSTASVFGSGQPQIQNQFAKMV